MDATRMLPDLLLLVPSLAGVVLLALRLSPAPEDGEPEPAAWLAGWIATCLFVIYLEVIALGSLGLLRGSAVAGLNLLACALTARGSRVRLARARTAAAEALAGEPRPGARGLLLFCLLFTIFVSLATTMPAGDFLSYHLANIRNFIDSGSTATVDPALRALGAPHGYTRGMEAILAFFYLFGLSREGTVLFGILAAAILLLGLRSLMRRPGVADLIFCLIYTTQVVQENIREIKNDLMIAALFLLVLVPALAPAHRRRSSAIPLAAALGLLVALKANGALYAALAFTALPASGRPLPWRIAARAVALALLAGSYFYLANLIETGNPVHPFQVSLAGRVLVPGGEADLAGTTVLANVDGDLPLLFLRGALRALGPAGLAAFGLGLLGAGTLIAGHLRGRTDAAAMRRERRQAWLLLSLLLASLLVWLATPYSDNTSHEAHSSLYSGHSMRFGLPFLLLVAAGAGSWLARRSTAALSRRAIVLGAAACAVNLFWYDVAALALKPANAFHALAPVVRSFSSGILLLAAALLAAASLLLARRPARVPIAAWLLLAVAIFHLGWPGSLGWGLQFKQVGATTEVFGVLEDLAASADAVSIHRRTGRTMETGIDYVLPELFARVHRAPDPSALPSDGVVIYAAEASVAIDGIATGRETSLSWDYMDAVAPPAGMAPVLQDRYFRVYAPAGR